MNLYGSLIVAKRFQSAEDIIGDGYVRNDAVIFAPAGYNSIIIA